MSAILPHALARVSGYHASKIMVSGTQANPTIEYADNTCTGAWYTTSDGKRLKADCKCWSCRWHGVARVRKATRNVSEWFQEMVNRREPIYFVTIKYSPDVKINHQKSKWSKDLKALRRVWSDRARRDGVKFAYVEFAGVKKDGTLHGHMFSNYIPDPEHIRHNPKRVDSLWLYKHAAKHNLELHILRVGEYTGDGFKVNQDDVTRLSKYAAKNLHETTKVRLPKHFRRFKLKLPKVTTVPVEYGNLEDYAEAVLEASIKIPITIKKSVPVMVTIHDPQILTNATPIKALFTKAVVFVPPTTLHQHPWSTPQHNQNALARPP